MGQDLTIAVGPVLTGGPPRRSGVRSAPGLLPRVLAWERTDGKGCHMRAGGSDRLVMGSVRVQFRRVRWLRRRSGLYRVRPTWVRKVATATILPGTAK